MDWQTTVYFLIGLAIGVVFHEYMHGRVADMLGDHTARNAGRLTLNPIPHIDPFGTILLPLALIVFRSPFLFGYAKPVPVNPFFFKNPRRDMMLVALAGPLTNFALAFLVAMIGMVIRLAGVNPFGSANEIFVALFLIAEINVVLAFFNLIPVPPLDGSHIVEFFLPPRAQKTYESMAPYGFMVILLFLWLLGDQFFSWMSPIFRLLSVIIVGA
ncbi:MAG: site-2 protease family protein [Actinobacteria bacterium]|nr:site-2 protease family protein [Actinomycetota bacterium]MCG2819919.1 site-2 protease family protein [Actinomycetes bacterium]MBU4178371.1 site-2 protease family protein [Actinomycetota bacterium]MBU4218992.1 site-2 protease family protein [Actinomycetota bacterium]MBU4359180.1 site-2 protease family protein [Actinomycetota bacterium]